MTPPLTPLVIFGTGGTCIDVLDILDSQMALGNARYECVGFLDDNPAMHGSVVAGLPVIGALGDWATQPANVKFANAIGTPRAPGIRDDITRRIGIPDTRLATLIHPSASVSARSTVGSGSILFQHVSITAGAHIGRQVIMLAGTRINHDDKIGDFTDFANNVTIAGDVRIGSGCYLGAGSTVIGGVTIASRALVGAGAVVTRDVDAGDVVAGIPARKLRHG